MSTNLWNRIYIDIDRYKYSIFIYIMPLFFHLKTTLGSVLFFLNTFTLILHTFIQQRLIKLIKSNSNTFIILQNKIVHFEKCFWTFYSSNRLKKCMTVYTNILSSTSFFSIDNVSWAANQHIRMISEESYEESCDTEAWCNDAENPALTSHK